MKKKIVLLICIALVMLCVNGYGQRKNKKNEAKQKVATVVTATPKTPYEKLFKKPHKKVKGLFTLHKIDNAIYLEIPDSLLNKEIAIASTVIKTSENGHSIVGEKPHSLKHCRFERQDSVIYMTDAQYGIITNKGDKVEQSLIKTSINPILSTHKIVAKSPDNAYVIDITSLFIDNKEDMDPFAVGSYITGGGMLARTTSYKKDRSFISDIKAFPKNVIVESTMSYDVSMKFMGMTIFDNAPYTAVLSRCIFLLPEKKMEYRVADPRIGYFQSNKVRFRDDKYSDREYITHRWRLEPKDKEAYLRGELVEPKKKITFYIDDKFPEFWRPYIKEGIQSWNMAFERAGFKNVIEVKDFPVADSTFDIGNIEYSCIHYAVSPNANAMGPSWVDPRTGEILNASVYVYHNLIKVLEDWRFIQTAQLDERVRGEKFSNELMGDCIRYVCAHEVGHCLGLMHNMAASSVFPVDSLRSATFTQKNGTTPSIMDYARYNYIAQPSDKGVKLSPPTLGEYDKYAIEWGYRYFAMEDKEKETLVLRKMITDKIKNPIYRYGKQQFSSKYDPYAMPEDLGDDPVKASSYGIANLKYISARMNGWFADFDYDYSYAEAKNKTLQSQYANYMLFAMNVIGGINLNEKYRCDESIAAFNPVKKMEQKRALEFIMAQLKNMAWLENKSIINNLPLNTPYVANIQPMIFETLLLKGADVAYTEYLSTEKNPYSVYEYYNDIMKSTFEKTLQNKPLTKSDMDLQESFVKVLAKPILDEMKIYATGALTIAQERLPELKTSEERLQLVNELVNNPISGFSQQSKVNTASLKKTEAANYNILVKTREMLRQKRATADPDSKRHYDYLIKRIEMAIGR